MLETERLLLRKIKKEDAPAIYNNWAKDKEVTKFLTWNPHENVEQTEKIVDLWLEEYKNPKTHRFGIVLKETNELIGMIDVVNYIDDCPEIGYVLSKNYWGKGIMTEACIKFCEYLFEQGFNKLIIKAHKDNIGSNIVIKKSGFTYTHEETKPCSKVKPELVVTNNYEMIKK